MITKSPMIKKTKINRITSNRIQKRVRKKSLMKNRKNHLTRMTSLKMKKIVPKVKSPKIKSKALMI